MTCTSDADEAVAWRLHAAVAEAESLRAALDAAQAEARRLRALPVLRTCADCRHCELRSEGGMSFSEPRRVTPRVHSWRCAASGKTLTAPSEVVVQPDEPPSWCPLRGHCGAQDAPGSHGPAADESEGGRG